MSTFQYKLNLFKVCFTLLSVVALCGTSVAASPETCSKHGTVVKGCAYCYEGTVRTGQRDAITIKWTNVSENDVAIRKDPGARLEIAPGQPAAEVGKSTDFGGKFIEQVPWFSHLNMYVTVALAESQMSVIDTTGAILLTGVRYGFKENEPAVLLKLTLDRATYDFKTRQTGKFSEETQCAVLYRKD